MIADHSWTAQILKIVVAFEGLIALAPRLTLGESKSLRRSPNAHISCLDIPRTPQQHYASRDESTSVAASAYCYKKPTQRCSSSAIPSSVAAGEQGSYYFRRGILPLSHGISQCSNARSSIPQDARPAPPASALKPPSSFPVRSSHPVSLSPSLSS